MWRKSDDARKPPTTEERAAVPQGFASVPEARPAPPAQEGRMEGSRIGRGLKFRGEIAGREDLHLDGEVTGEIVLTGATCTVGPGGRVEASVEASEIVVEGSVSGSLVAQQIVRVRKTGAVEGRIAAPRLAIEDGARVSVRVEMVRPGELLPDVRARETGTRARAAAASEVPLQTGD